jgi:prevent-host-death family protein
MVVRSMVNIQEAKTQLSRLVDRAADGEEIVVARNGRPVARLVALQPAEAPRRGGWARDEITIGPAFDDPLPDDVQAAFEGRA